MGKKDTYGASGRGDTLNFEPEKLKVIIDKKHPLYDPRVEREPSEALILSIMRRGVIVPLVIARDGDSVYVVDGRQRRAAAIEANKRLRAEGGKTVLCPCVWRNAKEAVLYEIACTTNEVRTGDSPLERAEKMQHLKDLNGGDDRLVAVAFGCTVQHVRHLLALLECAAPVRAWVERGGSATIASELSKLPKDEQGPKLEEMIAAGAATGARGVEAAKQVRRGQAANPSRSRMLTRARLEDVKKKLSKLDGKVAETAYAVVMRVLGHERAFANLPQLREAFDGEEEK